MRASAAFIPLSLSSLGWQTNLYAKYQKISTPFAYRPRTMQDASRLNRGFPANLPERLWTKVLAWHLGTLAHQGMHTLGWATVNS
jgi:hypothetical protein